MRLSIGTRWTLVYSALLLGVLLVFGATLRISLEKRLLSRLDETLDERLSGMRVALSQEDVTDIATETAEYAAVQPEGRWTNLRDEAGRVLYPPASSPALDWSHCRVREQHWKLGGQEYTVRAGTPLQPVDDALSSLNWAMMWAAPVLLALAGVGGLWVNRMAQRWGALVEKEKRFTADAAHELRTPLAVIRTTAELALRQPRSPEEYRQALSEIGARSETTTQLVDNLLTLARADAGSLKEGRETVDLRAVAAECVEEVRALAQAKGVAIAIQGEESPIPEADRGGLRRMVAMLLDNAVKYTPQGSAVTVRVRAGVLEVEDSGPGIPQEEAARIFERFYRVDPSRSRETGGHGLGLSIALEVARAHGATIEPSTPPGGGTLMVVRFGTLRS